MVASGIPVGGAGMQVDTRLCTFACICGNSFPNLEDYARHRTTRHTCSGCLEAHHYQDVWGLRRHLKKNDRPITACHCGEKFKTFVEMQQHGQTGHDCPGCQKPTGGLGALRSHINRLHIGLDVVCPHCEMRYAAQKGLNRHIALAHQLPRPEGDANLVAGNMLPIANLEQDEFSMSDLDVLTDRIDQEEVREGLITTEPQQEADQGVDQGADHEQGNHFGGRAEGVEQARKRTKTMSESWEETQRADQKHAGLEGQTYLEPSRKVAKTNQVNLEHTAPPMPPGISVQLREKVHPWFQIDLIQNTSQVVRGLPNPRLAVPQRPTFRGS